MQGGGTERTSNKQNIEEGEQMIAAAHNARVEHLKKLAGMGEDDVPDVLKHEQLLLGHD